MSTLNVHPYARAVVGIIIVSNLFAYVYANRSGMSIVKIKSAITIAVNRNLFTKKKKTTHRRLGKTAVCAHFLARVRAPGQYRIVRYFGT